MSLDKDTVGYLAALVRMDIRKHQKDIARFQVRPGQSEEEAAEILARFTARQEFRQRVLAELGGAACPRADDTS